MAGTLETRPERVRRATSGQTAADSLRGHLELGDLAKAERHLPYDFRLEKLSPGPLRIWVDFASSQGLALFTTVVDGSVRAECGSSSDVFFVGGCLAGGPVARWCGSPLLATSVCIAFGKSWDSVLDGASCWGMFGPSDLAFDLANAAGLSRESLAIPGEWDIDPSRAAALSPRIRRSVRLSSLRGPRGQSTTDLSMEALLGEVFACLSGKKAAPSNHSRRRAAVTRAVRLLHAKRGAICMPELARRVGVSQRTLEYGFRDYLALTPQRYARVHRLNGAYRDLAHTDKLRSVKAVATSWGFSAHGRFALEYRQLFGESPRQTLAKHSSQNGRRPT